MCVWAGEKGREGTIELNTAQLKHAYFLVIDWKGVTTYQDTCDPETAKCLSIEGCIEERTGISGPIELNSKQQVMSYCNVSETTGYSEKGSMLCERHV